MNYSAITGLLWKVSLKLAGSVSDKGGCLSILMQLCWMALLPYSVLFGPDPTPIEVKGTFLLASLDFGSGSFRANKTIMHISNALISSPPMIRFSSV